MRVIVTVLVALPPCAALAAVAASEKPCAAVTVVPIVAVALLTPVPVAVTVMVCAPRVAPAAAVSVSVLWSVAPLSVAGAKAAVTPVGRFVAASATSPVKFVRASVMVLVVLAPCASVTAFGAVEMVIDGAAVTVSATVAVAFATPVPAAVTVRL
ncbi:MAG: hypothetical protein K2R93_13590 [Gemmatimonadaceae bacterium]|nr:hypothetical protein [Gemmatimonadaceae bacterium]